MRRVDAVLDGPLLQQLRQEGAREGVARAVPVDDRLFIERRDGEPFFNPIFNQTEFFEKQSNFFLVRPVV